MPADTCESRLQTILHNQVSEVAGKANRTLGFLRRNFKEGTREVKAATYSTMVRLVFDYASTVWDPHQHGDIKNLEKVQRRAARYVYNDYTTRTPGCVTAMVKDIGRESLQDCLLYKMQHGLVDVDTSSYLRQGESWLVGCFGFNGPLRQYFSLYRAVSQKEGEREEQR